MAERGRVPVTAARWTIQTVRKARDDAVPVPREAVRQAVQPEDGDRHGGVEARAAVWMIATYLVSTSLKSVSCA